MSEKLTLREKLDLIDSWLCDSADGGRLANILSAVRGPDASTADAPTVKQETTNVIRHEAFPKAWGLARGEHGPRISQTGWDTRTTAVTFVSPRLDEKTYHGVGWHFTGHVEVAWAALQSLLRK